MSPYIFTKQSDLPLHFNLVLNSITNVPFELLAKSDFVASSEVVMVNKLEPA